jgi:hypothetical protein
MLLHTDSNTIADHEGTRSDRKAKWKPPPQGWVKLNTDPSFCPETGMTCTRVVVRDPNGQVMLTAWRWLRHCGTLKEAKAEACLHGVRLVSKWIK